MKAEYVILQSIRPVKKRGLGRLYLEGVRSSNLTGEPEDAAAQSITIRQEEMTDEDAAELSAEDTTLIAVKAMPLALIAPFAVADDAAVREARSARMSWGVKAVRADISAVTGKDITVAVLDTGIDPAHPAFTDVDIRRKNFTKSSSPDDEHGHGTHCAGTIFGRDVDGVRIGIARGVGRAFVGKVLDAKGRGSSAGIARAIEWAVRNKANVISMSVGFDYPGMVEQLQRAGLPTALAVSQALHAFRDNLRLFETLMSYARAQGAFGNSSVVVAACGNESLRSQSPDFRIETSLPAASTGIISVGAVQIVADRFSVAPFSNINPVLSAPGVAVVSARRGGGLVGMNGTSMACPHVAGVAALWWEVLRGQGNPTGDGVSAKLVATAATDVFVPAYDPVDYGSGLVRAP